LADYDRLAHSVRIRLLDRYPSKVVWGVIADARVEFAKLVHKIPNIGQGHVWQFNLNTSVMTLALYRNLTKYGYSLQEAVHVIYDLHEAYLNHYPPLLRSAYRRYFFSPFHRERLQRGAAKSQLCQYPDDWVFTYVEGDGMKFDFGVDIRECAIQKYFRAQHAEELTPHLCLLDHAMGKQLGLGFYRQGTLANGAAVCDCRWKLGAATQGWPPTSAQIE